MPTNSTAPEFPDIDFRTADFPSDALSIKRFRALFPDSFDKPGMLTDGFGDFFFPSDTEKPEHLMQLTRLISDERVIATGAFHRAYYPPPDTQLDAQLDAEEQICIDNAKKGLEGLYQFFKLANSPETARLLIRHVEEEGERQAHQATDRSR